MKRIVLSIGLATIGLCAVNWLMAEAPAPVVKPQTSRAAQLCEKLQSVITLDKSIDSTSLKDVLDYLAEKHDLPLVINAQAFDRDNGFKNVEDANVRLPKMANVRVQTVLRYLLDQVQGAVLVRSDHLELTTIIQQQGEAFAGRDVPGPGNPFTVNVVFDGRPLERALADIAEQTGKNVVLDPHVQDKEKLLITAQLLNTAADTSVGVVAELAGQKVVPMGNVFLVTTPDHAKSLRAEQPPENRPPSPDKP